MHYGIQYSSNDDWLEIWHHDVLRMDRKPPMGSLGGPTILTPGAPDPQKQGVENFKKNSTFQNHVKNPFQTISHRKKKNAIKFFLGKNNIFQIFQKIYLSENLKKIEFLLTSHCYEPTNEELNCDLKWQNINKLPHNTKTIAPSNFVLITKIITHGNMHPMNY